MSDCNFCGDPVAFVHSQDHRPIPVRADPATGAPVQDPAGNLVVCGEAEIGGKVRALVCVSRPQAPGQGALFEQVVDEVRYRPHFDDCEPYKEMMAK